MSDSSISQVKKICLSCYKDKRIWLMTSLVLVSSLISSLIIFQVDVGSNILYGFILFWLLIFSLLGLGLYKAVSNVQKFCKPSPENRHGDYLIGAGSIFLAVIVISMIIFVAFEDNYNYWIDDLALGKTWITIEIDPSDCNTLEKTTTEKPLNFFDREYNRDKKTTTKILGLDENCIKNKKDLTPEEIKELEDRLHQNVDESIKTESKWRKKVETLDEDRSFEIIKAKKNLREMSCIELFEWRYDQHTDDINEYGNSKYPERIFNSHMLVEKKCDQDRDYYDLKGENID